MNYRDTYMQTTNSTFRSTSELQFIETDSGLKLTLDRNVESITKRHFSIRFEKYPTSLHILYFVTCRQVVFKHILTY